MKPDPVYDQPVYGAHCPELVELFFVLDKNRARHSFIDAKEYDALRPSRKFKITFSPTRSDPRLYALASSIEDAIAELRPDKTVELETMPAPEQLIAAWATLLSEQLISSGQRGQAEEAKRKAFNQERDQWIKEHGSERLRKSLEHGYKANGVYVVERCKRELEDHLDLEVYTTDPVDKKHKGTAINPTLEDLQLLEQIQKQSKKAGWEELYPELDIYLNASGDVRIDNYLHFYSVVLSSGIAAG